MADYLSDDDVFGPSDTATPTDQQSQPGSNDYLTDDQVFGPQQQDQPAQEVQPEGAIGTFLSEATRRLPGNTAGALAGNVAGAATGALAIPSGPGAFAAGLGAAAAGAYAGQKAADTVQDKLTDAMGLNDPNVAGGVFSDAQSEANRRAHPYAADLADWADIAATMNIGAFERKVGTSVAKYLLEQGASRAIGAGVMGGINVGQQEATKGEVDPIEAGIATAAGAAFRGPRAWAKGSTDLGEALGARVQTMRGLKTGTGQIDPAEGANDRQAVSRSPQVASTRRWRRAGACGHPE